MKLLIIPKINIHNANALSSPYSIGFPAMTAWLGAVHALQRKLNAQSFDTLSFNAVGVISHQFNLQTYKDKKAYESVLIGTANPLDKSGKRPSFIEEARCHLQVTLAVEFEGVYQYQMDEFLESLTDNLSSLKMASGDIISFAKPFNVALTNEADHKKWLRKLMPGFALIERKELMQNSMVSGQDALDAFLEALSVQHSCELDDDGQVIWKAKRNQPGWIVPIATGFHGISELGQALHQRDENTPHRFAESLVTLGEFKMPYRFTHFDQILWQYQTDLDNNLYFCTQKQSIVSN